MRILLTGATGYIGRRLLPVLVQQGYTVVACVRDIGRFNIPESFKQNIEVIENDLLDANSLNSIPQNIDGAFYLVHSMSTSSNYQQLEIQSALNFRNALSNTNVKHVVYLSGIANEEGLSDHLASRKSVENELKKGKYNFTSLRAGIIIGSGSASYEIIRDLVEKLPIMVTPRWLNTKCQPISIADVISILSKSILNQKTYNKNFDIGGSDVLTYKEMLLEFAKIRKLKRRIFIVPVMTPKLSSYWLYFVTSTSYLLATALVNSMKVEVVCSNNHINKILNINPGSYKEALTDTFTKIEKNEIISSWKDAYSSGIIDGQISDFITVPNYGCLTDQRSATIMDRKSTIDKLWKIGGDIGWYYGDWLWQLRGVLDKLAGGVGLRRGRTNTDKLKAGDALDFWRVLYADKNEGRLLLYAEMKLPGEAWLEFKIISGQMIQTATFRPLGILGRIYWYLLIPFHAFIFNGMLNKITNSNEQQDPVSH